MKNNSGIDYFPFNTNFFEDDKVALIEGEFGEKGSYIAIRLLCKIYNSEGYYCQWGQDECLLFARRLGAGFSPSLVDEVVKGLVRRSFFDKGVYDSSCVLTSRGIQTRYIEAAKRRQEIRLRKDILLIDVSSVSNVRFIDADAVPDQPTPAECPPVPMSANNQTRPQRRNSHKPQPSDEEIELEIISFFFFNRNFIAPCKQFKKLVNYNLTSGRNWASMNADQRIAAAEMWSQKCDDGSLDSRKRFKTDFLSAWKTVYDFAKNEMHLTKEELMPFLDDRLNFSPDKVYDPYGPNRKEFHLLTCSKAVADFLLANKEQTRPLLTPILSGKTMQFSYLK